MTTAIKSAISPFAQPMPEPNANAICFFDEKLASVPASGIPENFRKLSRFSPVIVLVPKSAIEDEATQKKLEPNKSVTDLTDTRNVCLPLDAAKAWLTNSNAANTFEFGGVRGCLSTMEIHRNGGPVSLTSKEFKLLAYLIKNSRRVISRDELLNEVWGYENYPCTRTVDNHILKITQETRTRTRRSQAVSYCPLRWIQVLALNPYIQFCSRRNDTDDHGQTRSVIPS